MGRRLVAVGRLAAMNSGEDSAVDVVLAVEPGLDRMSPTLAAENGGEDLLGLRFLGDPEVLAYILVACRPGLRVSAAISVPVQADWPTALGFQLTVGRQASVEMCCADRMEAGPLLCLDSPDVPLLTGVLPMEVALENLLDYLFQGCREGLLSCFPPIGIYAIPPPPSFTAAFHSFSAWESTFFSAGESALETRKTPPTHPMIHRGRQAGSAGGSSAAVG